MDSSGFTRQPAADGCAVPPCYIWAMKAPGKRRRRLILGISIPVLLLVAYVFSYFSIQWIEGRRFEPFKKKAYFPVKTVYAPILWYEASSLPGSTGCWALSSWFHMNGRVPYSELYASLSDLKKSQRFQELRQQGEL
jgi:hypothetical protein